MNEILGYLPTCFTNLEYLDSVQLILTETEDNQDIPIKVSVTKQEKELNVYVEKTESTKPNEDVCRIEVKFSQFFPILVGTIDAAAVIMEGDIKFSSRARCLAFFQAMELNPDRYYQFAQILRETGDLAAAKKSLQKPARKSNLFSRNK